MNHKICTNCKQSKELAGFSRDKYAKDGFCHQCKLCRYQVTKKWFSRPDVRERRRLNARKFRDTLRGRVATKRANELLRNKRRFGGLYYVVLDKYKRRCAICGTDTRLVVHHVDGNGRNSTFPNNELENLMVLCRRCHRKIHSGARGV